MMNYLIFSLSSVLSVVGSSVFFKRYQIKAGNGLWATVYYLIVNGVVSALIPLVMLIATGSPVEFTWCSFIYACSLVLVSTLNNYFMLQAFEKGHVAIANTFSVIGGMLLSCVWGVLFLEETLSVVQVLGIVLIFAAVIVSRKDKGTNVKGQWFNLLMIFLCTGAINILSKMHQVETHFATAETISFSMWVGAIRAVFFGLLAPFMGKYRQKEGKITAGASVYSFLYSIIGGGTYIVTLSMAKVLPITVTTPLSTGISLVLAAVFAWMFHHERLSRAEIFTILLSLAGVMMIIR